MIRSKILATGSYLPEKILTNHDLPAHLETSHDWIVQRTGIHKRHIAAPEQSTADLGAEAAKNALKGFDPLEIDLIICATTTPDHTFPGIATMIQEKIEAHNAVAFDLQGVCSGYIYALSVAQQFIENGMHKKALVIGAETMSRILDWDDRRTCVLFGDGAGAILLGAGDTGILSTYIKSDGRCFDMLYVDGGVTSKHGVIKMQGREVFKYALLKMKEAINVALEMNNLSIEEIDWLVPHQANSRIILSLAENLNLTPEKILLTVDEHANTSAASIPLALDSGIKSGKLKAGQTILSVAFGGGMTWGSVVFKL